jgi:hypothetical protein
VKLIIPIALAQNWIHSVMKKVKLRKIIVL